MNWYRGTGGYAGLAYFELWTGFDPWKIQGQIFPGDPPPPYAEAAMGSGRPVAGAPVADKAVARVTGTHACPGANPDWTSDPDGTMHVRDNALSCTDTANDPRVSGTHIGSANMDAWGTLDAGAGVEWASVRLENAGGAWEGRAMGVASLPGRGDTIVIWYKGTGDRALSIGRSVAWEGAPLRLAGMGIRPTSGATSGRTPLGISGRRDQTHGARGRLRRAAQTQARRDRAEPLARPTRRQREAIQWAPWRSMSSPLP